VAYASEAGTPLIADPGYVLAREAIAAGITITSAPGPSAVIAALSIAGLPTDRFHFAGFAPTSRSARRKYLAELAAVPATLIIFESAKRVHKTLADMVLELGAGRQAALCRELTKKFEEVLRGTLEELCQQIGDRTLKGEIVVLVDRGREVASDEDLEDALKIALRDRSVKDAASIVAEQLRLSRRRVYQAALRLGKDK